MIAECLKPGQVQIVFGVIVRGMHCAAFIFCTMECRLNVWNFIVAIYLADVFNLCDYCLLIELLAGENSYADKNQHNLSEEY